MTFAESVLASIVAGLLVLAVAGVVSDRVRQALTAAFSRMVGADIERVFPTPRHAADDVRTELARSQHVALLTGRGNELQREVFAAVLAVEGRTRTRTVRILLPCTEHASSGTNWVADREAELAAFDPAFGDGVLTAQIRTTAGFLKPLAKVGRVSVRRYDLPHFGRILLTDRCVYLTLYRADAHSRDCKVVKYGRAGEMYDSLARFFEKAWMDAHDEENGPAR